MIEDAPMTAQDSLAAVMIAMSASDEHIRTAELVKMSNAINNLPVFAGYDAERLPRMSKMVFDLLEQEDGLEALFGLIRGAPRGTGGEVVGSDWAVLRKTFLLVEDAELAPRLVAVPMGD